MCLLGIKLIKRVYLNLDFIIICARGGIYWLYGPPPPTPVIYRVTHTHTYIQGDTHIQGDTLIQGDTHCGGHCAMGVTR